MTLLACVMTSTLAAGSLPIPDGVWRGGRPFIDPMDVHSLWWWTLVPMALFVSIAYKATRASRVPSVDYAKGVGIMTVQVVAGMVLLAIGLHVLVEFIVPWLD